MRNGKLVSVKFFSPNPTPIPIFSTGTLRMWNCSSHSTVIAKHDLTSLTVHFIRSSARLALLILHDSCTGNAYNFSGRVSNSPASPVQAVMSPRPRLFHLKNDWNSIDFVLIKSDPSQTHKEFLRQNNKTLETHNKHTTITQYVPRCYFKTNHESLQDKNCQKTNFAKETKRRTYRTIFWVDRCKQRQFVSLCRGNSKHLVQ